MLQSMSVSAFDQTTLQDMDKKALEALNATRLKIRNKVSSIILETLNSRVAKDIFTCIAGWTEHNRRHGLTRTLINGCWTTRLAIEKIAETVKASYRTVQRQLKNMIEYGIIVVVKDIGHRRWYAVNWNLLEMLTEKNFCPIHVRVDDGVTEPHFQGYPDLTSECLSEHTIYKNNKNMKGRTVKVEQPQPQQNRIPVEIEIDWGDSPENTSKDRTEKTSQVFPKEIPIEEESREKPFSWQDKKVLEKDQVPACSIAESKTTTEQEIEVIEAEVVSETITPQGQLEHLSANLSAHEPQSIPYEDYNEEEKAKLKRIQKVAYDWKLQPWRKSATTIDEKVIAAMFRANPKYYSINGDGRTQNTNHIKKAIKKIEQSMRSTDPMTAIEAFDTMMMHSIRANPELDDAVTKEVKRLEKEAKKAEEKAWCEKAGQTYYDPDNLPPVPEELKGKSRKELQDAWYLFHGNSQEQVDEYVTVSDRHYLEMNHDFRNWLRERGIGHRHTPAEHDTLNLV